MIRAVLDACVLYPPVLRGLLLGADHAGLYRAQWSDRIIEEWLVRDNWRAVAQVGGDPWAVAQAQAAADRGGDQAPHGRDRERTRLDASHIPNS